MLKKGPETHERRPFIGWDGEGYNAYAVDSGGTVEIRHRYMLFGSSTGHYDTAIDLGTRACLDLILFVESQFPEAFHVGFSFEYDVNMILRDLPWRYLAMLKAVGSVKWNGYRIKHIPHKMFSVSKNGSSATIYDVFGFFHCSYLKALRKFGIGTELELSHIEAGKNSRSRFTYADLPMVKAYWSQELTLMPELMDTLRSACYDAGFYITRWHGPGALASYAIRKYGISKKRGKRVPTAVRNASRYAYAGGRFQAWKCGLWDGNVYTADINSAYAYAASLLPRLDTGKWEHETNPRIRGSRDIADFALYRISSDATEMGLQAREQGIPFPLYHRDRKGALTWPARTEGWYWSPEAATVAGSKYATFHEAWIFQDDGERPFDFVKDAFERRLWLQERNNPAEKAYKWFLASIYGQLAQRVGWNQTTRTAPASHCLEWAGFITSYCRALVYRAAVDVAKRGGLISIDTDGVTASVPFNVDRLPNGAGKKLGQWKLEYFTGILYWQNGIYWLRNSDGTWAEPKTRGIPRKYLDSGRVLSAYSDHDFGQAIGNPSINLVRNRFVGYRQAMAGQFDNWHQWVSENVSVEFGGSGKGRHVSHMCRACMSLRNPGDVRDDGPTVQAMHDIVHFPPDHLDSRPHFLPWLAPREQKEENAEDLGIWTE